MVAKRGQKPEIGDTPSTEKTNQADILVKNIRALQKHCAEMLNAYSRLKANDPFAALKWLHKIESDRIPTKLIEQRQRAIDRLNQDINDLLLAFDSTLREECQRHSWTIHGQWPSYYVELFLRVEISEETKSIKIGERQLDTLYMPDVVAAVEQQLGEVAVERINIDEFVLELSAAYDQLTTGNHRQASIWQIYKQFLIIRQRPAFWKTGRISAFRSYDEQKFRAAFTKMLQRDSVVTPDNRELRIFPPIKAEDGMFLYHPVEGRHAFVGRIEFVPRVREAM